MPNTNTNSFTLIFDVTINSDEENVRKELDSDKNFIEKIHAII